MKPGLFLLLLLAACGPEKGDTTDTTADATTTATTGTATATATATDTAPTTGDPPSTTGTTGDACDAGGEVGFDVDGEGQPAPVPTVTVSFRNDLAVPVFVDDRVGCADVLPFTMFEGDAQLKLWVDQCDFTCDIVLSSEECGCPAGCGDPGGVIQINPGGVYNEVWSGDQFRPFDVDTACHPDACQDSCLGLFQTPFGVYNVRTAASVALDICEPCGCTPNAEGWCLADGARTGEEIVVEATLDYPNASLVELVFQ
jgi:hypothetical protein